MVGHALGHPQELHCIILEDMIQGKKTWGPRNSHTEQIKFDARAKTFKELVDD